MRFSATHRITTHLTVLFAHLSLILSGEPLSPWVSLIALVCLAISFSWEPKPKITDERAGKYAAFFGVLAVLYTFFELWRTASQGDAENLLLAPFAHFLLLFQSTRLFARRKSQDYLQIYVISFFELITATAINEDPSYALCFVGYSISITWALILFHLRREMEDNYLLRHSNDASSEKVEVERILSSKRIISSSFLVITGFLAFFMVLVGSLLSLLLPRMEGGPQIAKWRWQRLIGFSDSVRLGEFGKLRENLRVAMRVIVPEGSGPLQAPLYLKGLSFDHYDAKSWSRMGGPEEIFTGKEIALSNPPQEGTRLTILLEPLDSAALFVPYGAQEVSFPEELHPSLSRDALGNLTYTAPRRGVLHYEVEAALTPPEPPTQDLPDERLEKIQERYLQGLSAQPPEIPKLAREIVGDAKTSYEKARRVESYLRSNYQYSLEITPDASRSPLEDFLFYQKRGHCQYFATAMAILLRTQGVPTRVVNGFYGGEWNEYGGYYAIRQSDAHSWVEAYIPGTGWMRFDPTPTAPVVREGFLGALGRAYDAARFRWFSYFIDYDLFAQRDLFAGAKAFFMAVGRVVLVVGGGVALVVALFFFGRRTARFFKRRATIKQPPREIRLPTEERPKEQEEKKRILRLYRRALDLMAKRGHPKPQSLTAREYVALLRERGAPGVEVLAKLSALYEEARFSEQGNEQLIEELTQKLKELEREPLPLRRSR